MEEHFLTFGVSELPCHSGIIVIQSNETAVATITIQLPNEFSFKADLTGVPYFKKEGNLPKVMEDKSSKNYKEYFDVKLTDGFIKICPKHGMMIFVASSENIDDYVIQYITNSLL